MSVTPQPLRVPSRPLHVISVLLAAVVLALVLVAVGSQLVMSAASSPVPTHASVAAPNDSSGSNRARLPQ